MDRDAIVAELEALEAQIADLRDRLEADEQPGGEPEAYLDHNDVEDLQRAYDDADGNIADAAERFDISYGYTYTLMVEAGVHEPKEIATSDTSDDEDLEDDDDQDVDDVEDGAVEPEPEPEPEPDPTPLADDDSPHKYSTGREPTRFTDYDEIDVAGDLRGMDVEVPDGVDAEGVHTAVRSGTCETIDDVCRFLGVEIDGAGHPRGAMRQVLIRLGLYEELPDPERERRQQDTGGPPVG